MNPRLFVRLLRAGFAPLRGQRNNPAVNDRFAEVNRAWCAECAQQARAGPSSDPAAREQVERERQRYLERVERGQ